ncbi:nucleolar protein 53 [Entomortierella parvispora]|uniref:Ribosome biogenesis protein NOP53 n=1 Tax=Entomortierella parvispora TaxID=205924 RepID=A0A9P3HCC7_9FUNG|nr:nucleolar protein 53 [Entomortierella parvispora]
MSTVTEKPAPTGNGLNRKTSRKGKKAWRKNVDIADIEENLSELRAEERTTGGKVHLQSNDTLFTMDTKGDGKVIKELRKNRPLKMDEILSERSKIPAVSGRKKASTTVASDAPGAKATAKISKSEKARLLDMIKRKTSKSLFAPVDKSIEGSGLTDAVKAAGKFDIWGAADNEEKIEEPNVAEDDFVSEIVTQVPARAPRSFKLKQKVALPAVKESHPGASYNPTMQDHQGLLRIAHNEELRILADQQKVDAKLAYPKELDSMVSFDDQTGGLLEDSDEESEEEEEEEAAVDGEEKPKKKKGKKSIAERNRLARAAETAKKEAEIKRNKELIKQTNRVNEIMKTVEQEEEETEKKRLENEKKKEEKEKAGMKRVGRFNIPKERIHVQLQDELAESLRQLKPEGSLMKDRFQSFVERNLIEPRVPVAKRRRYRLKTYEKHSYKRFDNPNHA